VTQSHRVCYLKKHELNNELAPRSLCPHQQVCRRVTGARNASAAAETASRLQEGGIRPGADLLRGAERVEGRLGAAFQRRPQGGLKERMPDRMKKQLWNKM
jgi:hypothetical protein